MRLVPVLFVALCLAAPAAAQPVPPPTSVNGEQVSILVRSTIVALHQANVTGNYTVMRDLGSAGFRATLTAADLSALFGPLRQRDVELDQAIMLDAQVDAPPVLTTDGMLSVGGFFATTPEQIVFEMRFRSENGRWGLDALNVALRPPGGATPQGEAPASDGPPPRVETDPGFIPHPIARP